MINNLFDESLTLDPPGSIAVIGAGPLGLEAALYGRFLGYSVNLIEAKSIGSSLESRRGMPVPMIPDRCLSPLAVSAVTAQSGDGLPIVLPMTIDEWLDNGLAAIAAVDLLRDQIICPGRVTRLETVPIEPDEEDEDVSDVPPDFRLIYNDSDGADASIDAEAVIVATGPTQDFYIDFASPAEYLFRIGGPHDEIDEETYFWTGLHEIAKIYAQLAGRADLDLYRPRGS